MVEAQNDGESSAGVERIESSPVASPPTAPPRAPTPPVAAPSTFRAGALEYFCVTLAYTLLACAATWPVVQELSTRIIGGGELGGWLWRYWLMKLELSALAAEGLSFKEFFLQMISLGRFPETGNIADLYFISWPLDQLFGHPTYYNLKCLLILILNGLAGYRLARVFTPHRPLAFLGGVVLAFNSFVFLELYESGLRQAILWFLALSVGSLERVLAREPGTGRLRTGLWAGLMFGLTAAFYWFYGLFLGLFAVARVLLALIPLIIKKEWKALQQVMVGLIALGAVALPIAWLFAYPYIYIQTDHTGELPEVQWSTDFPSLEALQNAPMRPNTLDENLISSLARVLHSSWTLDYLWNPAHPRNVGVVVGVLGLLVALIRLRREWFWAVMVIFFWLHTGGPYLQTLGSPQQRSFVKVEGQPIRLPYAYTFKYVPMMSRLFAPYRSAGMMWVLLVVLVIRNLEALRQGAARHRLTQNEHVPTAIAYTASVLYLGQCFFDIPLAHAIGSDNYAKAGRGLPITSSILQVHPFYQLLAEEPGRVGIIELPLNIQQDLVNYYQVVHEKKIFKGWAVPGALPPSLRFRQASTQPATAKLMWIVEPDTPLPNSFGKALEALNQPPHVVGDYDPSDLTYLAERGFKYVILHERGCYLLLPERGNALYIALQRRLSKHLGEGTEFVELLAPEDPDFGKIPAGVLGEWASSALPGQASNLQRFHMTVFRMPDTGQ